MLRGLRLLLPQHLLVPRHLVLPSLVPQHLLLPSRGLRGTARGRAVPSTRGDVIGGREVASSHTVRGRVGLRSDTVRGGEDEALYRALGSDEFMGSGGKGEVIRKLSRDVPDQDDRAKKTPKKRKNPVRDDKQIVGRDGDLKDHKTPVHLSYKQQIKKLKMELNAQTVTKGNQFAKVRSAVEMLHEFSYEKQLKMKEKKNREVLSNLRKASQSSPNMAQCKVSPIVAASVTSQYRNKVSSCPLPADP